MRCIFLIIITLAPLQAPGSQEEVKVSQAKSRLSVKKSRSRSVKLSLPRPLVAPNPCRRRKPYRRRNCRAVAKADKEESGYPAFLCQTFLCPIPLVPAPKILKNPTIADNCDPLPRLAHGSFVTVANPLQVLSPLACLGGSARAIPPLVKAVAKGRQCW